MAAVFVTGATGFLGSHVVRSLVHDGAVRTVRALVRDPNAETADRLQGAEIVAGDLTRTDLTAALDGVDAVVHLATKNVDRDGTGFDAVNVDGTRALCDAALRARVARFIYVSSVGVYGHGRHRGDDERTPVRPDTAFSRSKAAAERIVLERHGHGFTAFVLRHRFVYGTGDESVIPRFMRAARRRSPWIGGGRARLSFVLADDLGEVVRRVATDAALGISGADAPVFHVTDGRPIAYRDVVLALCAAFGYEPPRFSLPFGALHGALRLFERLRRADPERSPSAISSIRVALVGRDDFFSNEKLLALLPGLRFTPFADGLRANLGWYERFR